VYTSESRALAVLEYTVNIDIHSIPRALSIVTIEIPDDYYANPVSVLPGDWTDYPAPASTHAYGTRLLRSGSHCVIQFPSTIIPEENNYILNPLHKLASDIKILDISDFIYDLRIKTT
jgi:RES domain-containing protein